MIGVDIQRGEPVAARGDGQEEIILKAQVGARVQGIHSIVRMIGACGLGRDY